MKIDLLNYKVIQLQHIVTVTKGGKIPRKKAIVVLGDSNKRIGLGIEKNSNPSDAIDKALDKAKINMFSLALEKINNIKKPINLFYGSSKILINPKKRGSGIIASNSIRRLLDFIGIKDVTVKTYGSISILNSIKIILNFFIKLKQKLYL